MSYQIKLIYSNICYAMLRNISYKFFNISFSLVNENIQLKIILREKGPVEEGQIEDFIAELSSVTETNIVLKPIIATDLTDEKLKYIVYELHEG